MNLDLEPKELLALLIMLNKTCFSSEASYFEVEQLCPVYEKIRVEIIKALHVSSNSVPSPDQKKIEQWLEIQESKISILDEEKVKKVAPTPKVKIFPRIGRPRH